MNAPTTKIEKFIYQGLRYTGHLNCEEIVAGIDYDEYANELYTITTVYDAMGNFETDTYETIQDLANAMKEIADLRKWGKFEPEY